MAELAGHFEDELAEFLTPEEREGKAQRLIEEFGDIKMLAILLRRAKKRCRPLWRKITVRSLQVLGVMFVYVVCIVLYIVSGSPNVSVNYVDWLNELAEEGRNKEENAYPYYIRLKTYKLRYPHNDLQKTHRVGG